VHPFYVLLACRKFCRERKGIFVIEHLHGGLTTYRQSSQPPSKILARTLPLLKQHDQSWVAAATKNFDVNGFTVVVLLNADGDLKAAASVQRCLAELLVLRRVSFLVRYFIDTIVPIRRYSHLLLCIHKVESNVCKLLN
jgi:hypothetical protein